MNRSIQFAILCFAALAVVGCSSGGKQLTATQREQATNQWNSARAAALASLANDQYREGNFEKCEESLSQAIALQPQNLQLRLLAAKLGIEQNQLEMADAELNEARKLDPQNAEVDYLSGIVYQRWQQFSKAQDAYAAASVKNPGEVSYVLASAEMDVEMGHPEAALSHLEAAQDRFSHSAALQDEIGQLLIAQKNYDDGITALENACRLSNNDTAIREHLAFALLMNKLYDRADQAFARFADLPEYQKRADVRAAVGECKAQTNQLTAAQTAFQSAVDLDASNAGYWLGLAKVDIQLNDLPSAEMALRRGLSLNATSAEGQCLLGYLRLKQNQLGEALQAFKAAADSDGSNSRCLSLQAFVLAKMNRQSEAYEQAAKALRIDPGDKLAGMLFRTADASN